uniref:Uncharacterized protein n=1 Tax=Anguilla anguilla TaxID=7936 RepID=A0A0E9QB16_ANGAN
MYFYACISACKCMHVGLQSSPKLLTPLMKMRETRCINE